MVTLRSARLEAIFGKRIEDLNVSDIHRLVANQVTESFDLDFKEMLYGKTDSEKRDLAGDVAALANTAGGLIVLGVAEDDNACASAAPGVAISDDEVRRILTTVGGNVSPVPQYAVWQLDERPGHGFILIAVPRSPAAPHAVLVNVALRYPARNGSTTRYLAEPEVADAYRRRFVAADEQVLIAKKIEDEAGARLARTGQCWILMSLVPDVPGSLVIGQDALRAFQQEMLGKSPTLFTAVRTWQSASVGRRRLIASGVPASDGRASRIYAELHDSGAGAFAENLHLVDVNDVLMVTDESIATSVISGAKLLAGHARDRAAAGGNALVRASVEPHRPVLLGHAAGFVDPLGRERIYSFGDPVERAFPLDTLASDGPGLVSAAHLLATDIFQVFGFTECPQLTRDGAIRLRHWSRSGQDVVRPWADRAGVQVTDEVLPA